MSQGELTHWFVSLPPGRVEPHLVLPVSRLFMGTPPAPHILPSSHLISLPHLCLGRPQDFPKCDLLIVAGTSLKVQPFASIIDMVGPKCPRLLLNKESCGEVCCAQSLCACLFSRT